MVHDKAIRRCKHCNRLEDEMVTMINHLLISHRINLNGRISDWNKYYVKFPEAQN